MLNVPLKNYFSDWRAVVEALLATIVVHLLLVFVVTDILAPVKVLVERLVPLVCTGMMPLLLVGVSKPLEEPESKLGGSFGNVEKSELSDERQNKTGVVSEEVATLEAQSQGTNGRLSIIFEEPILPIYAFSSWEMPLLSSMLSTITTMARYLPPLS